MTEHLDVTQARTKYQVAQALTTEKRAQRDAQGRTDVPFADPRHLHHQPRGRQQQWQLLNIELADLEAYEARMRDELSRLADFHRQRG
jgi:hypothetical protein